MVIVIEEGIAGGFLCCDIFNADADVFGGDSIRVYLIAGEGKISWGGDG
ncbi:MAG: hypothetical protein HY694_01740 [Deltaproteobacteria bacterium]|nr:hypothetical protein [Deltaproteobacteria bacterium]